MKQGWLISILLGLFLLTPEIYSFDGQRQGFVIGGGFGYGPIAKFSKDEFSTANKEGPSLNIHAGYAWDKRNMVVVMRETVDCGDGIRQGYLGLAYSHYQKVSAPSFYIMGGLGMKSATGLSGEPGLFEWGYDTPEFDLGIILGGGYEFSRHFQIHSSLSYGNVEDYTLTYLAILFTITAY